jgi:hypothetical protein
MGAVGALAAIFLLGAGTVILRNSGIEFPDTSIQRERAKWEIPDETTPMTSDKPGGLNR